MASFTITDKQTGKKYKVSASSAEEARGKVKAYLSKQDAPKPVEADPNDTPEMAARRRQGLTPEPPEFIPAGNDGAIDKIGAFSTAAVEGIPIVGPTLMKGARALPAGVIAATTDEEFGDVYDEMGESANLAQRANPNTAMAGTITGAVAPMVALGGTTLGGQVLGNTGKSLLGRSLASGGSNAAIGMADTAARGGSLSDIGKSGLISGGIGAVIPGAGATLGALGRGIRDTVGPRINSIVRPTQEATRRVGAAQSIDAANEPLLGATDEAAAAIDGQPLMNVDRGGMTSRSLLRSATNQDPEAHALAKRAVDDRFESQGDRAVSFIDRITGGVADDVAVREQLKTAAQKANDPAYKLAYANPAAKDMSSPGLLSLLNSPAVRQAAIDAEKRGANRAVANDFRPVRNPFEFADDGTVSMRDPNVRPTLEFWDQVKRNIDGQIGTAKRSGDDTLAGDLTALKRKLVSELDAVVPEYKTARAGAAAFFDAEDALEAGQKFVTQNRNVNQVSVALKRMNPAERASFAVGFASELKAAIKQSNDRVNVIKKIFGSQQSRDKIRLALGQKNFDEFEQFVKVEESMDQLRGILGGSDTTRKLVELGLANATGVVGTGIGAGGGTLMFTGDWKSGLAAGIVAGATRRFNRSIDVKMTKQIAKILLSNDKTALQRATTMAQKNPQAAASLDAIMTVLGNVTRGTAQQQNRPKEPLEITVGRGANSPIAAPPGP